MARNPQQREIVRTAFSTAKLAEARTALDGVPNGINRALAAAINKTLSRVRTTMVRGLTKYLTIKRKNLIKRTYIRKASAKSLWGTVSLMGRPVGAINFKHKENRRKNEWGTKASGTGVTLEVVKGYPYRLPNAFIATGNKGNTHIVQRTKFGGKVGAREGRFPIKTKFSQHLYDLFTDDTPVRDEVEAMAPKELDRQLDMQINRFLQTKS